MNRDIAYVARARALSTKIARAYMLRAEACWRGELQNAAARRAQRKARRRVYFDYLLRLRHIRGARVIDYADFVFAIRCFRCCLMPIFASMMPPFAATYFAFSFLSFRHDDTFHIILFSFSRFAFFASCCHISRFSMLSSFDFFIFLLSLFFRRYAFFRRFSFRHAAFFLAFSSFDADISLLRAITLRCGITAPLLICFYFHYILSFIAIITTFMPTLFFFFFFIIYAITYHYITLLILIFLTEP